jgi:hypothetical protein
MILNLLIKYCIHLKVQFYISYYHLILVRTKRTKPAVSLKIVSLNLNSPKSLFFCCGFINTMPK